MPPASPMIVAVARCTDTHNLLHLSTALKAETAELPSSLVTLFRPFATEDRLIAFLAGTTAGQPVRRVFEHLRVHDLKHTFGRRLRAAGFWLETRKVLLGHTNGDITAHYSAPEIEELLTAAEKVCGGVTPRTQ